MKITITQDFDTVDAAEEFLSRLARPDAAQSMVPATPEANVPSYPVASPKPRKPRADAGKPRGAYKPRENAPQVEGEEHANAKPEGAGAPAGPAASTAAPLAVPSGAASSSAASAKSTLPDSKSVNAGAAASASLTLEDLRAVMSLLNAVPGKGMTANIASLRAFGVVRISDLPLAKYAEFDAHIRAQLPKAAA